MAKVHLLDDELINKIAAGEVVERPASVVKELVENAIDAGAQHIRVSLKDGGRQLIEISDDGHGMSPEDAVMALKRHTTSKLRKADELFEVSTMGFRGEALASISSVSRLTLQTMSRDTKAGIRVQHEDGTTSTFPWQGSYGTTLTVKDLFFNVPARKTFMKTAAAEFAVCHEYLQALALSLPHLGFRFLHNDKEVFSVSPLPLGDDWERGEAALRGRAQAILGEDVSDRLIYVKHKDKHLRVEGLISPPGVDKSTAKHIFTFVNHRWVKDKTLRFAILRGYHSHLLRGKFPVAILHIDMEASLVDVNVHPAKTELRFQYGSEVQDSVAAVIRESLRKGAWGGAKPLYESRPEPTSVTTSKDAAKAGASAGVPVAKPAASQAPIDFDLLLTSTRKQEREDFAAIALEQAREKGSEGVKRTTMSFDGPSSSPAKPAPTRAPTYASPVVKPAPAPAKEEKPVHQPAASTFAPAAKAATQPAPARDEPVHQPAASTFAPVHAPAASAPAPVKPSAVAAFKAAEAQAAAAKQKPREEHDIPWDELKFVGAFQKCYLFFEHHDHLLVLDQHAFHERILYERLLKNPGLLRSVQKLLMPEVLEFSPEETVEFDEKREELKKLGFDYEVVSGTEIEVRAVPSLLVNKDIHAAFASLLNGTKDHQDILHEILATVACHAAVRAGEELPEPELKQLIGEAKTVDFFLNCPHGRRVLRWFKANQVAAWFDRLG